MKPICIPCSRFYRAKKNGFYFTEGMPKPHDALPGNQEPEKWKPYKVWVGDLWECRGCGNQIVVGFGTGPIRVQHDSDFADERSRLSADQFQVNDC